MLRYKKFIPNDNKYLAVVTNNGLWIKDEINKKILIVNSQEIQDKFLINNSISEFDENFQLIRVIESKKIDISKKKWIIIDPVISSDNKTSKINGKLLINSHFDFLKINSLYRDLSSLNFLK